MADNNFIASVDIGSSKIVILLAEEEGDRLRVFGHGIGKSAGVKKGVIIDTELASQAIQAVAEKARLSCNTRFHNVSVNLSDPHLTTISRSGQIFVTGNRVAEQDMDAAIKTASAVPTPANKQVISSVANGYTLDKDPITHRGIIVDKPIGEQATTLEVNMHIVTASNQCVSAVEKSVRGSNLGLSNIAPSSMASSEAYLTQDEKDNGVCLIDMGSEVTNLSTFTQGGISHSAVLQIGGGQITERIADAFDTSFAEAERLKLAYGHAQSKSITADKLLKFQQLNNSKDDYHYLSQQSLLEVIEEGYLVLFSLIRQALKKQKLYRILKSGFVLTGGASKIEGCADLLLNYVRIRSKLGRINTNRITAEHRILDPIYACALGLLLFEPSVVDFKVMQNNAGNFLGKIKQQFDKF